MFNTLLVVDNDAPAAVLELPSVISFTQYLHDYPKKNEPKTRIINLCKTDRYLSQGYYCSLLAEARNHQVLPSVKTINELRGMDEENNGFWLFGSPRGPAKPMPEFSRTRQVICMGLAPDSSWQELAARIFRQYPAPLLRVEYGSHGSGYQVRLRRCALQELSGSDRKWCLKVLAEYTQANWRKPGRTKRYRWDLAILVNQDEAVPPSNKSALSRFTKAARKLGIQAQTVSMEDLSHVNQFDALFIRETTAIDHHTYRLACQAEANGLVVLDDPNSILRCCNKVFLHDAFQYQNVPALATNIVDDASGGTLDQLEAEFGYPLILKTPEGSFSRGVFKVTDRKSLQDTLTDLLRHSALVLAQEFLYTDFDWRIGVLNGRAIYACRYYMARNHWQIYNHGSKRFYSGGFDALPTFEVPKNVLGVALKAARVVGDGLYGVDIKARDNRAYVLEVNDNPNIDHGVEDHYLGEELYMQIMAEFLRRLEMRGR